MSTYGTLDLDNDIAAGGDRLASLRKPDLSILGQSKAGKSSKGEKELHDNLLNASSESNCTGEDEN